jgi:hypothetical protein
MLSSKVWYQVRISRWYTRCSTVSPAPDALKRRALAGGLGRCGRESRAGKAGFMSWAVLHLLNGRQGQAFDASLRETWSQTCLRVPQSWSWQQQACECV